MRTQEQLAEELIIDDWSNERRGERPGPTWGQPACCHDSSAVISPAGLWPPPHKMIDPAAPSFPPSRPCVIRNCLPSRPCRAASSDAISAITEVTPDDSDESQSGETYHVHHRSNVHLQRAHVLFRRPHRFFDYGASHAYARAAASCVPTATQRRKGSY
jgi:hypothetical protein